MSDLIVGIDLGTTNSEVAAFVDSIPFTETRGLEFRAEMFNIFNHPTFAAPTSTINTSSGGQVGTTLNAARIIQLALKVRF